MKLSPPDDGLRRGTVDERRVSSLEPISGSRSSIFLRIVSAGVRADRLAKVKKYEWGAQSHGA